MVIQKNNVYLLARTLVQYNHRFYDWRQCLFSDGMLPLRIMFLPKHCLHEWWTKGPWLYLRMFFNGCHLTHWVRTFSSNPMQSPNEIPWATRTFAFVYKNTQLIYFKWSCVSHLLDFCWVTISFSDPAVFWPSAAEECEGHCHLWGNIAVLLGNGSIAAGYLWRRKCHCEAVGW